MAYHTPHHCPQDSEMASSMESVWREGERERKRGGGGGRETMWWVPEQWHLSLQSHHLSSTSHDKPANKAEPCTTRPTYLQCWAMLKFTHTYPDKDTGTVQYVSILIRDTGPHRLPTCTGSTIHCLFQRLAQAKVIKGLGSLVTSRLNTQQFSYI